jgi:hypothetical protein
MNVICLIRLSAKDCQPLEGWQSCEGKLFLLLKSCQFYINGDNINAGIRDDGATDRETCD